MKSDTRWAKPMKLGKLQSFLRYIRKSVLLQAGLVGLAVVAPFVVYVSLTNTIIAPLNILEGWDVSSSAGSVVAKIPSDVNQQMLPFRQYVKDSLVQHQEIPLWNTRSFAGDVFLANPINVVLSPLNLLLFIVDIYTYQNVVVLFGIFLSASCAYLLLRQLKASAGASIIGSIAYSLAPFSIFWSIYGVISIPMAAVPLVLFLYYKWRESGKSLGHNLVLIALALGITIYVGHIQIALLPFIVLGLAALFDILFNAFRDKRILYLVGTIVFALLIGFAQLGALVSQTPASHRSTDNIAVPADSWNKRAEELARIPNSYNLASGPTEIGLSTRRDLHIGQIPGVLFILGVLYAIVMFIKKRKLTTIHFFLLLFVFGAFWKWNDFPQTLLNALSPTLSSLASDYFLPIGLLAMAVLSAFGLDALTKLLFRNRKHDGKGEYPLFVLAIPLVALIAIALPQLRLEEVSNLTHKYYLAYYMILIAALLFYVLLRHIKVAKTFFVLALVTAALMQGWALYRVSQPIVPASVISAGSAQLKYITTHSDSTPTIVDYIGPQESGLYNVSLISGYDSLYSTSLLERVQAINYPNETPPTYRNNSLFINTTDKPTLFQNLGVAYTINKSPQNGYTQVAPGVFKSDMPSPEIYFADTIKEQTTEAQLETIKTGEVAYQEVPIAGVHTVADKSSSVRYSRTANTLTITTQSPNGGLLFIAQTYNKDWSAQLEDGKKIDVLAAYYNFTALDVPAGDHVIHLRYQPVIITIGFIISGFAVTAAIILLLYSLKLRRLSGRKKET